MHVCCSLQVTVVWVSYPFVSVHWRRRLLWVHGCQWCRGGAQGHWGHPARYWSRVLHSKPAAESPWRSSYWWLCCFLFQSLHLLKTMSRQSQLWKCLLWCCLVTYKDVLSPLSHGPRVEPNWAPEEEVIVSFPPVKQNCSDFTPL